MIEESAFRSPHNQFTLSRSEYLELYRKAPISTIAQLLAAEEFLDEFASSGLTALPVYQDLEARALAFIRKSPELLSTPWLRVAGAVHDLIERVREEQLLSAEEATESLFKRIQ